MQRAQLATVYQNFGFRAAAASDEHSIPSRT
jgi:hypothetical protein